MVSTSRAAALLPFDVAAESRREPPSSVVDACRRGDREAVAALFESCKDRVYSLALHLTGDPAEAADVTQDVFLRVLRAIDQYRGDARFTTWLYRVVVNVFLDRRKSRRRFLPLDEGALAARASADPTPEASLIHAQAHDHVARRVAALPVALRLPLVLRFGPGLSYAQIAETLGVREGTVASRLNRALKRLERELREIAP